MSRKINRVGDRYGKLLVIEEDTKKGNQGQIKWICRCDCGNVTSILTDNLRTGITKSCGCLRNEACIDEVGNMYGDLKVISRVKNNRRLVLLSEEEYTLVMQTRNDALDSEHEKLCAGA